MRNPGRLHVTLRDDICLRINDALEKLIQTKKLSDISVVELCQLSGVPRSTFYSYYCDIYAVPQCLWDKMMENAVYKIGANLTWDQGHRFMFQKLLKHKVLFTKICWENDYNSLMEYGYREGFNSIKANIENRKKHEWTENELIELDYTIKALAILTIKWERDGMIVPVETIVHILNTHIPVFLKDLCDT